MELDVAAIPVNQRYNLMIGSIVPRPIAVVGTCDAEGRPNLAPYSFFMGCGTDPMTLVISVANPPGGEGEKDTLRNAKPVAEGGTGEFTVSVATEENILRVVACAEPIPHGESEFELAGLTPVAGTAVRAPRPAESPVTFECRTMQVVRMAPGKPGGGNLLVGQVVRVHVADGLASERMHVDADRLRAVGRMGGLDYCRTAERAEIPAGRPSLTHALRWIGPDEAR
jgi:flavin reductase (DIM6/NTAB) family NADH-FMN oxidoreductase RutF